jgi:predicted Fe-Mo cluster-binding NifX family protein
MKIAVPITDGVLSDHFGHCERFAFFDARDNEVRQIHYLTPPSHEPGAFPKWLKEQGAELIIAGGMGRRAQDLFSQQGIQVISGAPSAGPNELVELYLEGDLVAGENKCTH